MLPLFLALTAQPLAAAIMALLGTAFWLRFGPRPMPGLLPGLLMMTVIVNNTVTLMIAAYHLMVKG